jgi:predicted Zn-dependent protease
MKRKHKRNLTELFDTVKTIVVGVIGLIAVVIVFKSVKNGQFEMKSIYNTLSFNTIKKSDTLYVVGDNTVSYSKLLKTKQIIESYFGLKVKISERITLDSDLFNNGYLIGDKVMDRFDDENDKIIITEHKCIHSDNSLLAGVSEGKFGNILLVGFEGTLNSNRLFEETVIHELSHNFGIEHCQNPNCLMFWMGSHLGKHDMCDDCKEKLLKKLD